MTLNRLVYACYNVFPGKTKLKIVDNLGKCLYCGLWNDGVSRDFGSLKVLDFEIGEMKKNGVATVLTAWVVDSKKEDA